jgi:DNA-binding transcriptional LysR family regulator
MMLPMNSAHDARPDLNLLYALEALLTERSVTRAASKLGLTQPAMSHALRRLREQLGDPILVRGSRGMVPTPRAQDLAISVRRALEEARNTLESQSGFEPLTSRRSFTLSTADLGQLLLLPPLLARLTHEGPGIDLNVRPLGPLPEILEDGTIELALGTSVPEIPGLYRQTLFTERFVCVVREGHPKVKKKLDLEQFVALQHILISPKGLGMGTVDRALAERGLSRRVALRVPSFLAAPMIVAESDLVLTCPSRIARALSSMLPLKVLPPPLELTGFTTYAVWHERMHHDPAHMWLRRTIVEVGQSLGNQERVRAAAGG